jgi:hypothetical protein
MVVEGTAKRTQQIGKAPFDFSVGLEKFGKEDRNQCGIDLDFNGVGSSSKETFEPKILFK